MKHAKCRGKDPNIFLGETPERRVIARITCSRCPVKGACLAYAIEHEEVGIWADTNDKQRMYMRMLLRVDEAHSVTAS